MNRADEVIERLQARISELEGALSWHEEQPRADAIHIVFDGPPGPACGRFVEAEDAAGRSINARNWSQRADGYWQLVIKQPSGVVVGALASALEGIVHDERVPNEVSQYYAALLIEARRLNPCRAQSSDDAYDWGVFPGYLIDECEGEVISEELLQRRVADMLSHPHYGALFRREKIAAAAPSAPYAQQKEK